MPAFQIDDAQSANLPGMTREYPYCMCVTDITDFSIPWCWHEELELNYVRAGSLEVVTGNARYAAREGDVYFINSSVLHTEEKTAGASTVAVSHRFHPALLSGHFKSVYETKYVAPVCKNRQLEVVVLPRETDAGRRLLSLLQQAEAVQGRLFGEFQVRNLLSEAWIILLRELEAHYQDLPRAAAGSLDRIRAMMTFIHRNYARKISLMEIADSAGIGEREALRCFQKTLNRSPFDYLNEFRLNQARALLEDGCCTIAEIAARTGFSSTAYFGKVFKKAYRMTPSDYQKRRRPRADR